MFSFRQLGRHEDDCYASGFHNAFQAFRWRKKRSWNHCRIGTLFRWFGKYWWYFRRFEASFRLTESELRATSFQLRNKIPTRCPLYLFCFFTTFVILSLSKNPKNKKGCRYHRGYVEVLSSYQRQKNKESEGFNISSRRWYLWKKWIKKFRIQRIQFE